MPTASSASVKAKKLPNFKLLHQREQQRVERFKEAHSKLLTRPQPFRLHTNNFISITGEPAVGTHPADAAEAAAMAVGIENGAHTHRPAYSAHAPNHAAPMPPPGGRPASRNGRAEMISAEQTAVAPRVDGGAESGGQSGRGVTPRTARLYKLLSGNPNQQSTVPRPPSGASDPRPGSGAPAHVRLDLNAVGENRPRSAAPPVRSNTGSRPTSAVVARPPGSARAVGTSAPVSARSNVNRRPKSARPSEAATGAHGAYTHVRTSGHRGYAGQAPQPNVDAMVRRYKESIAAWNHRHDYQGPGPEEVAAAVAASGPPRPQEGSSLAQYYQRPPSAPAAAASAAAAAAAATSSRAAAVHAAAHARHASSASSTGWTRPPSSRCGRSLAVRSPARLRFGRDSAH